MLLVEQSIARAGSFAGQLCLIRSGRSVAITGTGPGQVDELVRLAFAGAPTANAAR